MIDAYRVMNDSVFTCFLDASKAFDRINHCRVTWGKKPPWGKKPLLDIHKSKLDRKAYITIV